MRAAVVTILVAATVAPSKAAVDAGYGTSWSMYGSARVKGGSVTVVAFRYSYTAGGSQYAPRSYTLDVGCAIIQTKRNSDGGCAILNAQTLVFDPLLESATMTLRTTTGRGQPLRATVTFTASSPPTPVPSYGVDPAPPYMAVPKLIQAGASIAMFRDAVPSGRVTVGRAGGKLTGAKRGSLARITGSWAAADT